MADANVVAPSAPTVALVHGAFADSSGWTGVIHHLRAVSGGKSMTGRHFRGAVPLSNCAPRPAREPATSGVTVREPGVQPGRFSPTPRG